MEAGEFDVAHLLIYNRFHSVISQVPTATQLIPAPPPPVEPTPDEQQACPGAMYEFEPDEETILRPPAAAEPRHPGLFARCWKIPGGLLRRADEQPWTALLGTPAT